MTSLSEPLVSIVVVTYNSSETVLSALDSALNQTINDYEIIVTDDASRDNTVELINKWAEDNKDKLLRLKGFRILNNSINKGVAGNCNTGASEARGKYIQFLAGDDELFPDAIERKSLACEENDLNLVFSDIEICFRDSFDNLDFVKYKYEKTHIKAKEFLRKSSHEIYLELLKGNFIFGPMWGFVNKNFFLSGNGYDENYPLMEDYPYLLKYFKNENKVYFIEKKLCKYYISKGSLSYGERQDNSSYLKVVYKVYEDFIKDELIHYGMVEFLKKREDYTHKDKIKSNYSVIYHWMMLKQQGFNIADYFKQKNMEKIAVYGMGDLAFLLMSELKNDDVKILFGIDMNLEGDLNGIQVYPPTKIPYGQVDAIVVTLTCIFDTVKENLKKYTETPVLSLEDIILYDN